MMRYQGIQTFLQFWYPCHWSWLKVEHIFFDLSFLRLGLRSKSEVAYYNWLSSVYRSLAEWATSAASSAKRRSRNEIIFKTRFALRRARLKWWPSALVWSLISELIILSSVFSDMSRYILENTNYEKSVHFKLI